MELQGLEEALCLTANFASETTIAQITAITSEINLPHFWTNHLSGWFYHTEYKFLLMKYPTNDHICFLHVVGALQPEVQVAVRDVTNQTQDTYTKLKTALVACFSPSLPPTML